MELSSGDEDVLEIMSGMCKWPSPDMDLISTVYSRAHLGFNVAAVFKAALCRQRPPLLSRFNHIFCRLTKPSPGRPFFTRRLLYHAASCHPALSPASLLLAAVSLVYHADFAHFSPPQYQLLAALFLIMSTLRLSVSGSALLHISSSKGSFIKFEFVAR